MGVANLDTEKSRLLENNGATNGVTNVTTNDRQISDKWIPEIRDKSIENKEKENINILAQSSGKQNSEPKADVEALVLNDGTEWVPPESLFAEYVRLYPNVDVKQQFNEMRSWCLSNPAKRKTPRGIKRFVNSWLSREQDKGYRRPMNQGAYQQTQTESGYARSCLTALRMRAEVIWVDEFNAVLQELRHEHVYRPVVGYKCRKCKDTGFVYQEGEGQGIGRRCDCYAMERVKHSNISDEFQKKTFDNFYPRGNEQLVNAKEKAMRYVKEFQQIEHDRRNSIMFCGQVGSGKTHLGTAICGDLLNHGVNVSYMAYRNVVTKIKQNIINEVEYNRELNRYTSARLLYIDDLLKGKLTESDVNILYEIVNYRYMNNLPLIISTEKSIDDLLKFDEAIGSRIIEMCRGNIVQLQGKELNYRLSQGRGQE